jgi:hypothetical protein
LATSQIRAARLTSVGATPDDETGLKWMPMRIEAGSGYRAASSTTPRCISITAKTHALVDENVAWNASFEPTPSDPS